MPSSRQLVYTMNSQHSKVIMVRINQLFMGIVPLEIVRDMARLVGLQDLSDTSQFTKYDVRRLDCANKIDPLLTKLRKYYTPSRCRLYLDRQPMPEYTVIVIFRQLLRLHNYSLRAKERNVGNTKITIYQVVNHNEPPRNMTITKRSTQVSFS